MESNILYGIHAWGSAYNNSLKLLEHVQNKILKIIYNKYKNLTLFNERFAKILSVKSIYFLTIIKYKINYLLTEYKLKENSRTKTIKPTKSKHNIGQKEEGAREALARDALIGELPKNLLLFEKN